MINLYLFIYILYFKLIQKNNKYLNFIFFFMGISPSIHFKIQYKIY